MVIKPLVFIQVTINTNCRLYQRTYSEVYRADFFVSESDRILTLLTKS